MERAKSVALPGADPDSPFRTGAQRDPWIGQAIKTRYKVSRRLAAGPSGNLYTAQDGETGAAVTIKLLPIGIELDDDQVRRLRDELSVTRAVARIRPNVAIVHDCDRTAGGRAFLVLEPLAGQSLADVIDQGGALPVERALRLAFEIADGLQAAHNLALVHGALDAEDVLVGAEDTVKLMGFEVARLGEADLEPRPRDPASRVGIQGAQTAEPPGGLTEQADIQALGRLLMQMLTGAVQPRSEGSSARPERQLGPEVPAAVRELVIQALAQSPERRAPDMGSVASALWVELYRVAERPIPTAPDSAAAGQPRGAVAGAVADGGHRRPGCAGRGGDRARRLGLLARFDGPATVSSTIQAGPARRTPPARAPRASAPAPVGRSAEVAGRLPITPPPPRGEPIPRNEPAIESPPRVTPEGISVMPRATPPDPALPATTTPATLDAGKRSGHASHPGHARAGARDGHAPDSVSDGRAPAACARNGRAPAACARNGRAPAACARAPPRRCARDAAPAACARDGHAPAACARDGHAPAACARDGHAPAACARDGHAPAACARGARGSNVRCPSQACAGERCLTSRAPSGAGSLRDHRLAPEGVSTPTALIPT
jgi:serine/threonine protein kinase